MIKKFSDAWKEYRNKNDWKWVKKKPLLVKAIQMEMPFEVYTLEGNHKGKAGDYLIEGIRGECYPCDKEIFEESYEQG